MDLKTMIWQVRQRVGDPKLRVVPDPVIASYLNEGKNQLVRIIQQADESFFQVTVTGTISATSAPNASEITLPPDFCELKDIKCTQTGYEDIKFHHVKQYRDDFREALVRGGSFANGTGRFMYDFYGLDRMILSPGSDIDLPYQMDYIRRVDDMSHPDDWPTELTPDMGDYMMNWASTECLRHLGDPRVSTYEVKLETQKESIVMTVNRRTLREVKCVTGFMEEEGW